LGGVLYGATIAGLAVINARDWIDKSISWVSDNSK
jgi:hypothetical protein